MRFLVAWPDGTRTAMKMDSMRELDKFVDDQFSKGSDVDLVPGEEGLMLLIDAPKWTPGHTLPDLP